MAKVALFSALICRDLDISMVDTIKIMVSSIVHDIGRTNNCNDANHGDKAVELLKAQGYVLPDDILSCVSLHCRGDRKLSGNTLAMILKDADALDRVRTNDLDESMLRFECSKKYINLAVEVNRCLLKANE